MSAMRLGLIYYNLVCDCLAVRDNHQLCDWAYLLMLKGITDQFCGAGGCRAGPDSRRPGCRRSIR